MAMEVKAWGGYYSGATALTATMPTSIADACTLGQSGSPKMGPNPTDNKEHTEWGDGKCNQTGATTTFPPNSQGDVHFQWRQLRRRYRRVG